MARVSSKYSNTEILKYSTILIIEIGFGKNIITSKQKQGGGQRSEHPIFSSKNLIPLTKEHPPYKKISQWGNPLQNTDYSVPLVELVPI